MTLKDNQKNRFFRIQTDWQKTFWLAIRTRARARELKKLETESIRVF